MKKITRTYINKKWQKGLGIICLLGLILASAVFLMDSSQEKKEVSAHPTNTISLGSGEKQFEVPIDGAEHLEYPSSYSGYQQLNTNIPSLGKQLSETEIAKTKLFSSQIYNNIIASYLTGNGNIISMHSFSTYPYTGNNYTNQQRIILQSSKGEILDAEWVRNTPNHVSQVSGSKRTYSESFFKKSSNEFVSIYSREGSPITTTTFIDEGNQLSISNNDKDKAVNMSSANLESQPVERAWVTSTGTIMAGTAIYPTSTEKRYYKIPEHQNGVMLNVYSFEASPEISGIQGIATENGARINADVHYINATTFIGTERITINKQTTSVLSKWIIDPMTKQASRTEILRCPNSNIAIRREISDSNVVYFDVNRNATINEEHVELRKLDMNTLQTDVLKIFPRATSLKYSKYGSNYFYIGFIPNLTGEFAGMGEQPGIYYGYMDSNFSWKSASSIQMNFLGVEGSLNLSSFVGNEDIFILSGSFSKREVSFIDEVIYGNYPGEVSSGVNKEWVPQIYSPGKGNGFVSILKKTDDWSPLIKPPETFTVDSRDSDVDDPDILDRWLLTGSKNGNLTDNKSVQVYDTTDIDNGLFIYGINWLRERINKNPKSLEYETDNITLRASDPIDWVKLGFDKNKAGAQLVTYFVTDSQNQTSSTSTYVNNLLDTTITDEEQDYALDAKNFHVPLSGIETTLSSPEKLKKLAKTMAWNLTNHEPGTGEHGNGLDEDGAAEKFSTSKVEVNTAQLTALQSATVAKPYPIDITYKPEAGIEIVNRVWVFVTTDNTVADTETGVVYYADDYTIPYYSRVTHDLEAILDHGNIKAYNYYAKDTTAELTALPNKTGGSSNWSISNLTDIHDPFSGGPVNLPTTVQPQLIYTWNAATDRYHTNGETTSGSLDVTLTGDVLLHVRQVIQEPSNELVVPTEGYLTVQTTVHNGGSPTIDPNYQSQVTITSGKKADDPSFTTFALSIEQLTEEDDQVNLTSIIPEFYQYNGYYVSNEKDSHGDDALNAPNNTTLTQSYLYEEGELWITLYLEPNGTNNGKPQPYSWDYKHNDLGIITE